MPLIRGQVSIEGRLLDWAIAQPTMPRLLPIGMLDKEQIGAELVRVQQRRAADAAYEAELICGLADRTPDDTDPDPDSPGGRRGGWAPDTMLPGVSEFFTAELAVVLGVGRGTAAVRARRAWTLRESLPATRAAMAAGELDERRGYLLADVLAHTDPTIARVIEARLLPQAAGLSLTRLRSRPSHCCSSSTPTRSTAAAPKPRRPRTCGPTPPTRTGWACSPRTCRRRRRRPAIRWSTRWRRCSRPTATPARSARCAPPSSPC